MSNLHTDDKFMYQNASTTDPMQASYENQLLGDRVSIDDATPAEWDALPRRKREPIRDAYDQVSMDYNNDFVDLTVPQERESILDLMAEQNQKDGLYDKAPLSQQIGGDHYRQGDIQPIEYIHANDMDFFSGNVVKYITRWKYKNGLEDLKKAKHYIELLMEQEYGYNR